MTDRSKQGCAICGGTKTIPDAELCGYCKLDVKKIYRQKVDDLIKNNSKSIWLQAKDAVRQKHIKEKYDEEKKRNSAGFKKSDD